MPDTTELHRLLHRHFGFHEFLEGQEPVIEAIAGGQDTLVIMPTGGGKSLCYQFPAMFLDGITVVVSPLIALMKDQVDSMVEKKIPATFINSSLSQSEMDDRIERMKRGEYRLVYVAPERFKSERFVAALAPLSIALFAIDEAHCISQWGHDFRPDYLRLKWALKDLGQPQVAALTATATPEVCADIIEQLSLGKSGRKPPQVFVSGFARHNLTLAVTHTKNRAEKLERIFDTIHEMKTGIIYCATRKNVERVYEELAAKRLSAIYYHGGMSEEQRTKAQDKFMSGQCAVAVATNAFGMGVDRADLRFVTHYDIPGSVEAYYQEAGRAGRDGEPARCELLFNYADVKTQEFFVDGANPTREIITSLYLTLLRLCKHGPVEMPMSEIAEHVKAAKNDMAVGTALYLLQRAEFIARDYRQGSRTYTTRLVEPVKRLDDLSLDFERLDAKRKRDSDKLWRMIDYVDCHGCRHGYILNYFGETDAPGHCSACDNCASVGKALAPRRPAKKRAKTEVPPVEPPAPAEPLEVNDKEKTVFLQKALSCVARMDGRFGLGRITQVLTGSRSKEVFNAQLDELSTYGLLKEFGYDFTQELLRRLVAAGCIEVTADQYPKASLTELGRQVMLAKTPLDIELPPFAKPKPAARKVAAVAAAMEAEAPYDAAVFEALRQWRRDAAGRMGIPAYLVYPDATLKELSRQKPQTHAALLEVRGIGPAKARQFGAETLEIIREVSA